MTEEEIRQRNEERRAKLDAVSRRNMEKCAAFIARMIEKYGREVLASRRRALRADLNSRG